jgi:hypothetical protein
MCSQIINPSQDFLQHKYPNGSTQCPNAMAPGALGWKEAPHAVDFRDQFGRGSLALERD